MKHHLLFPLLSVGLFCVAPSIASGQEPQPAVAKPAEVAKPVDAPPAQAATTKSALDLLPAELLKADGSKVSKDSLKGKMVGLYFSAHWCPPCRQFTPVLVAFRDAHTADFDVIFISSDKSAEAMKGYMTEAKMQWPAVPFGDPTVKDIKGHFAIRGIPSLIILGADGQVISKEGRGDVSRLKDGAIAAWKAKSAAAVPAVTPPAVTPPATTPPATP